jgi:hypothetical protein
VDFVRYLVDHGSFDDAEAFLKDLSHVDFAP